jgi:hypothetical protein
LQALAAAGTRLLQGKLGIGSSSSSSSSSSTAAPTSAPTPGTAAAATVPVKKHSINIDLEERDEDLSAAMSKVTIHTEGNKNVALVSSLEAEGIKKTLSLLSAHKRTIAETVEVSSLPPTSLFPLCLTLIHPLTLLLSSPNALILRL